MNKLTPALLLAAMGGLALGPADAADEPDTVEDPPTIAIVTTMPEKPPIMHVSRAGLGSLYWAARHPVQAWRVLLPAQEESVAYDDLRASCAITADTPSAPPACP